MLRTAFTSFLLTMFWPIFGMAVEFVDPLSFDFAPTSHQVSQEPSTDQSAAEQSQSPRTEPSSSTTEVDRQTEARDSGLCVECGAADVSAPLEPAAMSGLFEIMNMSPEVANEKPLYTQFIEYVQEFQKEMVQKKFAKGTSRYMIAFIKGLYEKMKPELANQMVKILTVVAEVGGMPNDNQQMAEIAAIMKVIDNRAQINFCQVTNRKASLLSNAGVTELADAGAENSLCNGQFSCWTPRNNILNQLFTFDPEITKESLVRRVELAFLTHQKMAAGEIQFYGGLDSADALHYHANYVRPKWAKNSLRLKAPIVAISERREDGMIQVEKIPLSKYRGPIHYFYSGVEI